MSGTNDPLSGLVLDGRFELKERVGIGGMGAVYRARQLNIDRDVAVKLLHPLIAEEPDAVRRFENEARIIAQLRDPHTLKLIDFGRMDDGQLYIVTEYLAGCSLKQVLQEDGKLEPRLALGMLRQICDALAEAHAEGVVHRDLKPGNLFVERVGHRDVVKVLDFGIARWSRPGGDVTTGPIHGTPEYMSPEQARGEKVDGRSDLYALGCIAYECLAGVAVFESETAMGLLLKHLQDLPPPFDQRQPPVEIAPEIEAFVMRLLEKDPDHRPAGALALADELDLLLEGRATHSQPLAAPPIEPPARPPIWPWALGALLGAGALGWALWPSPPVVTPQTDAAVVSLPEPAAAVDAALTAIAPDAAAAVPSPRPVDAARPPPDAAATPKRRWRPRPPPPRITRRPDAARPPPAPNAPDAARPPGPFIRVVPKPK